jgi:hypothetical protein
LLLFLATLGALYILVLLVSGQPVGGDAAAASWGIIFQLTRFALIQPCYKTSNQKRSNLKAVCEKTYPTFLCNIQTSLLCMSNKPYRLCCSRQETQSAPLFGKRIFIFGSKKEEGSEQF